MPTSALQVLALYLLAHLAYASWFLVVRQTATGDLPQQLADHDLLKTARQQRPLVPDVKRADYSQATDPHGRQTEQGKVRTVQTNRQHAREPVLAGTVAHLTQIAPATEGMAARAPNIDAVTPAAAQPQSPGSVQDAATGLSGAGSASAINNLALQYKQQGRWQESEALYLQALSLHRSSLPPDHPQIASSMCNLAALYHSMRQPGKAEPLYLRALEMRRRVLPRAHPELCISLNNLAVFYKQNGQISKAEALYKEALQLRKQVLSPDDPSIAKSLINLAILYAESGRLKEADALAEEALSILPFGHTSVAKASKIRAAFSQSHPTPAG